jgi:hypothetical protein
MPPMKIQTALAASLVFTACTSQELYSTGQQWQKQECGKLQDRDERTRCEKSRALSYDRYKAQADAARSADQ